MLSFSVCDSDCHKQRVKTFSLNLIIFHNVGVCENAKQALPDDFNVKDCVPDSDEEQNPPEDNFDFIITSLNDSAVKFKTSSIIMSDEESSEKDDGVKETGNK